MKKHNVFLTAKMKFVNNFKQKFAKLQSNENEIKKVIYANVKHQHNNDKTFD